MRAWLSCFLLLAAFSAAAHAQAEPLSARYAACRAAANGGDGRIDEICRLADDIHERLQARDAARHPARYAQLQHALGSALFVIGDLGDAPALRDSITAEQAAAEHFTRSRTPTYWATIQLQIGGALVTLAGLGDPQAAEQAIPSLTSAIDAIRRSEQPELWASLHTTLASAYVVLSDDGADRTRVQQAIAALQNALEIYRRPVYAEERARIEARLAELLRALGGDENNS